MPDTDARTQTAQYPEEADDFNAAREFKKVLSLSLPSFYCRALRVMGNKAGAEDAMQEALLAAHRHLHHSRILAPQSTQCNLIRQFRDTARDTNPDQRVPPSASPEFTALTSKPHLSTLTCHTFTRPTKCTPL
jgi:hypothetical protein